MYVIWACRRATSVLGPATSMCKSNGEILRFETREEAQQECNKYNNNCTSQNVFYTVGTEAE